MMDTPSQRAFPAEILYTGQMDDQKMAEIRERYSVLTKTLIIHNLTITTMESCTSGQIASLITDTEGSSAIFTGAYISYSNSVKEMLGISAETIQTYGVYSPQTAAEMAKTCRNAFHADIGIGITGSMGNIDPANLDSIPGEVYFAIDWKGSVNVWKLRMTPQKNRLSGKFVVADAVLEKLAKYFRASDET